MRRALRSIAALMLATAAWATVTLPAAGQEADETVELPEVYVDGYGWWSKVQQNPVGGQNPGAPVPVGTNCQPTDVNTCPAGPPADGLYVVYDYEAAAAGAVTGPIGNAPVPSVPQPGSPAPNLSTPQALGPTAYSAVRFVVPEGAETELSLPILSRNSTQPGGSDPTIGKLFACLVSTPGWAAVQNGRYDQGPKFDCTTGDEADLSGDSAIFNLSTAFVQGNTLDVVIVGAGERPFQMALAAPTEAALRILNADELASGDDAFADFVFEDPLTSFESLPSNAGFASDVAITPDDVAGVANVPVARPQPQRAVNAGRIVNPFSDDASRGERIMAVLVLLAMGLGLWWVGGQPLRQPRLLGSLASERPVDVGPAGVRGIGRFARPRAGSAPRLF